MLSGIKSLIFVLLAAAPALWLAKPLCLRFMSERDFQTRRTAWCAMTAVAFLSPDPWLYLLVVGVIAVWAGGRDSNPMALFVMLRFAGPVFEVEVPKLVALSHVRVLLLCLLIPALLRGNPAAPVRRGAAYAPQDPPRPIFADLLLFVFCTLQVVPFMASDSVTAILRRELNVLLDIMLPYLACSRLLRNGRQMQEVVAVFAWMCAVLALLGALEAAKAWLVYVEQANRWGVGSTTNYLMRAGQLRAQVSTGHSLGLGFVMAVGFGFCLQLLRDEKSLIRRAVVLALMWVGLLAAYSRGPWLVAVLVMFAYFWLQPGGTGRVLKVAMVVAMLGLVLYPTPWGQRIAESLPFVGHVDSENVEYRQRLMETALRLIPQHPWFGDIHVLDKMEDLRQGEGIIDLVNGYLLIALYYGLVPLAAWVVFTLIALVTAQSGVRKLRARDPQAAALGSVLLASMVGSFLFIYTAGFASTFWLLAGMTMAYGQWAKTIGPGQGPVVEPAADPPSPRRGVSRPR